MDATKIGDLIEASLSEATAIVTTRSAMDEDDHYEAVVVSPDFVGKSLVQQHQLVYDALGDHMTRDIHALELSTFTPAEYDNRRS